MYCSVLRGIHPYLDIPNSRMTDLSTDLPLDIVQTAGHRYQVYTGRRILELRCTPRSGHPRSPVAPSPGHAPSVREPPAELKYNTT